MSRIAIFLPGRGSYTKATLGSLPDEHPWIDRADALRAEYGLGSLRDLDRGPWKGGEHLRADNAAPLIHLVAMIDAERAAAEHETVCVGGNSLGWYTALSVAGALDFDDGFRLVQEMAQLQMSPEPDGGQILYPLVDEEWRLSAQCEREVEAALASAKGEAFPSIALGGFAVLAGSEAGIRHLLDSLPPVEVGPALYPFRLKGHGPYHTPLLGAVATGALERLGRLGWRAPAVTLIDGRGVRFSPWATDPGQLAAYTLGEQVVTPFGFTTSVRIALREYAPDLLVLPGPGNTLGSVCGQILAMEGYRAIHDRGDFAAIQESESPVVWSMRR